MSSDIEEEKKIYLVKVQAVRQSSYIELPSSRISNPSISLLLWIAMYSPFRMWKNLNQLLRLWVTIWITNVIWFLQMHCISRTAVQVISWIWEPWCLIPVYFLTWSTNMIRRTRHEIVRPAPATSFRVDNHFTVSSYIGSSVAVARISIVLPTASYVKEIELAVCSTSTFNVKC